MSDDRTPGKTDRSGSSGADVLADTFAQWTENWQKITDLSIDAGKAWSNSMLPFLMMRAAERGTYGDELGESIERLAQGPKLADVWDIDRKLMSLFVAWSKMRQRLTAYNANTARPWMRALERYRAAAPDSKGDGQRNWREEFAAWSAIANEEMIRNQRSEDFLRVQRELLQAGIEFRKAQTELSETMAGLAGLPTQSDMDELSRQLTELRREVRALARERSALAGSAKGGRQGGTEGSAP